MKRVVILWAALGLLPAQTALAADAHKKAAKQKKAPAPTPQVEKKAEPPPPAPAPPREEEEERGGKVY